MASDKMLKPDKTLKLLCKSAGDRSGEALALMTKLITNIIEKPEEEKFRRVNPENLKLKQVIFCHDGAEQFFRSAGFVKAADGILQLPEKYGKEFIDAQSALVRCSEAVSRESQRDELSAGAASAASGYKAAVEGGAKGAGHVEIRSILGQAGGPEALKIAERVLLNIRRYPDSKQYRSVNVSKPAGKKVLPALPLLKLAGFEQGKLEGGEDALQLGRTSGDVLERIHIMVWWATQPTKGLREFCSDSFTKPQQCALGALFGAAIGDALGASLANALSVTAAEADKAMEMCGGGPFTTAAGQTTSNTELMVCHAVAMSQGSVLRTNFEDELALEYGKWGQTRPFQIEFANSQAFTGPCTAAEMEMRASTNQNSCGNGALLRSLPSAVCLGLQPDGSIARVKAVARADTRLSHPSPVLSHASVAYAVLANQLVQANGDRMVALQSFQAWTEAEGAGSKQAAATSAIDLQKGKGLSKGAKGKDVSPFEASGNNVAFDECMGWLKPALAGDADLPFADARQQQCLAQISLQHAFRHLRNGSSFEAAMRATLAGGGDAHSNAAAVGGLMGAAVGLDGIPEFWVRAVLNSESSAGHVRPPEYHPRQFFALLPQLCSTA